MTRYGEDDGTTFIVKDIDTTAQLKKLARYEEREPLVQMLLRSTLAATHGDDDDDSCVHCINARAILDYKLDTDR